MMQTKRLYDILLDALCCMMVADDEVSATEKSIIVDVLEECEVPHSAEDVSRSIESFLTNVSERGFASILEATLESARTFQKQDKQKVILSALTIVAKADGVIDDTEREVFASFKRVLQRIEVKKNLLGRLIISYDCPKCTERLTSPIKDGGVADLCPNCHAQFTVPLPEEVAVEAPARYQTSVFNKDTYTFKDGRWIKDRTGKFAKSERVIAALEAKAKTVEQVAESEAPSKERPYEEVTSNLGKNKFAECPACGVAVKVKNLLTHYDKVHHGKRPSINAMCALKSVTNPKPALVRWEETSRKIFYRIWPAVLVIGIGLYLLEWFMPFYLVYGIVGGSCMWVALDGFKDTGIVFSSLFFFMFGGGLALVSRQAWRAWRVADSYLGGDWGSVFLLLAVMVAPIYLCYWVSHTFAGGIDVTVVKNKDK